MKTSTYNPSPLELAFAKALNELKNEIAKKIPDQKILGVDEDLKADNPCVIFKLQDNEGDKHEIVVKFIQRLEE